MFDFLCGIPQLSSSTLGLIWGWLFALFAGAYWFDSRKTRKAAALYCWASCATGLIVFYTSPAIAEYLNNSTILKSNSDNYFQVGYFLYSVIDLTVAYCLFVLYKKHVTSLTALYLLSVFFHLLAVVFESMSFYGYFILYEYIMVIINLLIIVILFHGSIGYRFVCKCLFYIRDSLLSLSNFPFKRFFSGGSA